MSARNIKDLNREVYLQKSEEMLLSYSDAYFYKKHFLLGTGINKDKVLFYMQLNKAVCTNNCEMTKLIKDKINGKLEKCKTKAIFKYTHNNVLELQHTDIDNCCSNKIGECLNYSWSELSW
jgi:hypothetical protein